MDRKGRMKGRKTKKRINEKKLLWAVAGAEQQGWLGWASGMGSGGEGLQEVGGRAPRCEAVWSE